MAKDKMEDKWEKIDPVKLAKEAEAKEAKHQRKIVQRLERAEARKEKRHMKSEAKQLRKLNGSKRAGKWHEARKLDDKMKKKMTRPHKLEKRRLKMPSKADRFESQARDLMKKAHELRARYKVLTEQKEREDKEKLGYQVEQMAKDPNNNDYISLEPASATYKAPSEEEPKEEAEEESKVEETKVEQTNGTSSDKPKDKKKKKSKKAKEDSEASELAYAELKTAEPIVTEAKDDVTMNDVAEEPQAKKSKKEKSEKKANKKRKREAETEASVTTDVPAAPEQATADENVGEPADTKRKKKAKKAEKSDEYVSEPLSTTSQDTHADGGEQWNVGALEGGDARKQKFLRLLGAKKTGSVSDGPKASQAGHGAAKDDIAKIQSNLERQFEAGMRAKNEHQGKKGLGA